MAINVQRSEFQRKASISILSGCGKLSATLLRVDVFFGMSQLQGIKWGWGLDSDGAEPRMRFGRVFDAGLKFGSCNGLGAARLPTQAKPGLNGAPGDFPGEESPTWNPINSKSKSVSRKKSSNS